MDIHGREMLSILKTRQLNLEKDKVAYIAAETMEKVC